MIADWSDNGRVDGVYTLDCYQTAIDAIPVDLRDYTNAADVISRALTAASRQDPPSGGAGTRSSDPFEAVPVAVEVTSPQTAQSYVKSIYIIADKNRRPLNAKFNLTPAAGLAYVGTNLRLGESTDVRAVAEMSDGTLLAAKREVKVTVGGCGG